VQDDVVLEDEAAVRRVIARPDQRVRLERRVVIDGDVGHPVQQLEQAAVAPGAADVLEQVVVDGDAAGAPARVVVVAPEHVDARGDVANHVVGEHHVLDHRPRRLAVLVARGEEHREAVLAVRPVVLEQVAVDDDAAGVLQLEQVLDRPRLLALGFVHPPRQRLRHVVVHHLDVGGHEVRHRRVGAAEHHVLARGLEVVVGDAERSGAVPPGHGLRIGADLLEVGDVGIDHGHVAAVEGDATAAALVGIAVHVAAVDDDVMRLRVDGALVAAEAHDLLQEHAARRRDLESDEAVVMGAGLRFEHRAR
jgi:hypothetical protein